MRAYRWDGGMRASQKGYMLPGGHAYFMGGGGVHASWGVCASGEMHASWGACMFPGGHACFPGDMLLGDMCGCGGVCVACWLYGGVCGCRGACVVAGGVHV